MSSYSAIEAGRAGIRITAEDATAPGLSKAEARLRSYGQTMQNIGSTGALTLAAGLAPAIQSVRTFTAFADQMAVVKAVTGATGAEFAALNARAEELGRMTSFTATDVAGAMTELSRAGFNSTQTLAAIGGTLNTARAGNLALAEATVITTDTLRSFNLEADQTARVGDVIAKTANMSSTDMGQVGQAMKYVATSSSMAGQKLESVSGALAVLANRGLKADMAGTSLAQVFVQLTGTDVQKKLAGMGVAVTDVNGDMRNLVDIMDELGQKTAGMGNTQKLGLFKDLFDVRGMRAAAILAGNSGEWRNSIQELQQAQGTAARMAAQMDDTIGGSWRSMASAVEGTQIAFGKSVEGPLRTVYGLVTDLARGVSSFIENNRLLVSGLSMTAGALTLLSGGLYATGLGIKTISYGIGGLKEVVKWAGALGDRYREQLAQITTGQSAQAAKAASTNAAAAAEEKLAVSSTGATAAMKGQAVELARIIALLDKLVVSASGAAVALERQTGAQTASVDGWARVSAALQTVLAVTLELNGALATQAVALKGNTASSAKQAQSVKALAGWQTKLAAATARATAAQQAQAAATAEQAVAAAGAARGAQMQAQAMDMTTAAAARNSIATGAATVAAERYAIAALGAQRSIGGIAGSSATSALKDVTATVVETSGGLALMTTRAGSAAAGIESVAKKASLSQKALAGWRVALQSGGKELLALAAAYGVYKLAQYAHEQAIGEDNRQKVDDRYVKAAEDSSTATEAMIDRLNALASNTNRTASEQQEMSDVLSDLQSKYDGVKVSIDEVIASRQKLDQVTEAARRKELENQKSVLERDLMEASKYRSDTSNRKLATLKENTQPPELSLQEHLMGPGSLMGLSGLLTESGRSGWGKTLRGAYSAVNVGLGGAQGDEEELNKELQDAYDKEKELRDKLHAVNRKLQQGNAAQNSGGGASGDAGKPGKNLYTGLDEGEFKSAQERLTSLEDQFRRERQTGLQNEIDDIRQLGEEYQKLLADLAGAARHQGKDDLASEYEARLKAAGEATQSRIDEVTRKAQASAQKAQSSDLSEVDQMLSDDVRQQQLGEQNRRIDEVTAADPARAMTLLQQYQEQLTATVGQLQQQTQEAIRGAYADGEKSPEENDRITGLRDELQQQLSRRTEISDALLRAQEAAAEPQTWEVRGAFGAAAGALGTGTSSLDEKQTKSLDNIDGNIQKLQESFDTGIKLRVS